MTLAEGSDWAPAFSPELPDGSWYVTNVRYPSGALGCVSNKYADGQWRIVADPVGTTFSSRDSAARAERMFALGMRTNWVDVGQLERDHAVDGELTEAARLIRQVLEAAAAQAEASPATDPADVAHRKLRAAFDRIKRAGTVLAGYPQPDWPSDVVSGETYDPLLRPTPLLQPLDGDEIRRRLDRHGMVTGVVLVDLGDLIGSDLRGWLAAFSEKLVGSPLLKATTYRPVGVTDGGEVLFEVTGDPSEALASFDQMPRGAPSARAAAIVEPPSLGGF